MKDIQNALEVIKKLNEKIFDEHSFYSDQFYLHTDGYNCQILFEDKIIWKNYEDDREFIENLNEYEDLYNYCIKQIRIIANDYLKIHVKLKDTIL